jgi:hypothetical protein
MSAFSQTTTFSSAWSSFIVTTSSITYSTSTTFNTISRLADTTLNPAASTSTFYAYSSVTSSRTTSSPFTSLKTSSFSTSSNSVATTSSSIINTIIASATTWSTSSWTTTPTYSNSLCLTSGCCNYNQTQCSLYASKETCTSNFFLEGRSILEFCCKSCTFARTTTTTTTTTMTMYETCTNYNDRACDDVIKSAGSFVCLYDDFYINGKPYNVNCCASCKNLS